MKTALESRQNSVKHEPLAFNNIRQFKISPQSTAETFQSIYTKNRDISIENVGRKFAEFSMEVMMIIAHYVGPWIYR